MIHSRFSPSVSAISQVQFGSLQITPTAEACNLGVLFDHNFSYSQQINNCCKSSFFALSQISKIRKYLDQPTAERLVHAFVTSRLDQCNSLFYGLPEYEIKKLQCVLNSAARVVARPRQDEDIRNVLKRPHWLPVKARIEYKILMLVYKSLHGLATSYLKELLHVYCNSRVLRSNGKKLPTVPTTNTKSYGDRSFLVAGPRLWNKLPLFLRDDDSYGTLKTGLKTLLSGHCY